MDMNYTFEDDVFTTQRILTSNATDIPPHSTLTNVGNFVGRYYIWVIFAFGCPGNLLSICVIARMCRKEWKTQLFHVALLAAVDNIAIILKIIEKQIASNKIPMEAISCKFLYFLGLTLAAYPNWILILISAERFRSVRYQIHAYLGLMCSLKKSLIVLTLIFLFLCLVNAHFFFTVTSKNNSCKPIPDFMEYQLLWFFISSSVYALVPAASITIYNVLIVIFYTRQRHHASETLRSHGGLEHQEEHVTIMMVTVSVVFIVLTIPRCIFIITWNFSYSQEMREFLDVLTSNIADTNHAVNFYLYFISGSTFRTNLKRMFQCKAESNKSGAVTTTRGGLTSL